jgi:hypothetical protein
MTGEECFRADLSYGDELYIECGEVRQYREGPMRGRSYGAWQFYTRNSDWNLKSRSKSLVTSMEGDPSVICAAVRSLVGHRVSEFAIDYPDLGVKLRFGDKYSFEMQPRRVRTIESQPGRDDSDEEVPELAHWELITPDGMILAIWRVNEWTLDEYHTT